MANSERSLSLMGRWGIFIKERFEPVSSLTMILLFFVAHLCLVPFSLLQGQWGFLVLIFLAVVFFFFKLRLYDEIKDYQLDLVINPTRPLPRGLLSHRNLHVAICLMIMSEIVFFYFSGQKALFAISIAIVYSLFMYKEFFIPQLIRPHLTTYAMSHTIVTVLLGMAIFSALFRLFPWELPKSVMWFVLNNWFMFNIFEFGRKTFSTPEERVGVESYSKIFTRYGAVGLVLSQALLSSLCLWEMDGLSSVVLFFSFATTIALGTVGVLFSFRNDRRWGAFYRIYSSLHIVLFYSGFILLHLFNL